MMYTGNGNDSWSTTDFGALARIEHRVGQWQLFGGFSRTIRAADATERYLGANSPMTPMRWIGNPDLDAAKHHQLDLGAGWRSNGSSVNMTLFGSDVDDYILRDRAHGQEGILQSDNATIYRNVSARRYGFEADGMWQFASPWNLAGRLAWVWAENTTDSRAIAQTPPLHGNISVGLGAVTLVGLRTHSLGGRADAGRRQPHDRKRSGCGSHTRLGGAGPRRERRDRCGFRPPGRSGQRLRPDLCQPPQPGQRLRPSAVRVNEPGRTIWLRVGWRSQG